MDGNLTFTNSATLDMDDINNRELDLEGDFTITSGTFLARAGNHNVEGNWDCSGGTIASSLYSMMQGIQILRIHDVNELIQSIKIFKQLIKK